MPLTLVPNLCLCLGFADKWNRTDNFSGVVHSKNPHSSLSLVQWRVVKALIFLWKRLINVRLLAD
jgi:hypothetical protein